MTTIATPPVQLEPLIMLAASGDEKTGYHVFLAASQDDPTVIPPMRDAHFLPGGGRVIREFDGTSSEQAAAGAKYLGTLAPLNEYLTKHGKSNGHQGIIDALMNKDPYAAFKKAIKPGEMWIEVGNADLGLISFHKPESKLPQPLADAIKASAAVVATMKAPS